MTNRLSLVRGSMTVALVLPALSVSAQDDIQALADRWSEAYNQHDRAALSAVYSENAHLMTHGSATIIGRNGIEDFWAADFEVQNPLTLLTVTHSVEGSDMMLVHGDYSVIDREARDELGSGRFAHIWTRGPNGDWALDRDLWSEYFDPYSSAEPMDSEVQTLAHRWTQAYNQHDRAALASVYTDDARLMMHGGPAYTGRSDIEEFWAADFEEGNPITLLGVTHALEGVDMILVHGNYQIIDREDFSLLGSGRFAHIWTGNRALQREWQLDTDLWYER